jgi:hypothetical protein
VRPARFAVSSLALGFLLALATTSTAWVAACGGSSASSESDEPESEAEPETVEPDEDNEMAASGKDVSAWRWKGKRKSCFYLHSGRCFSELEAACRAAGCGESRCKHDKSAPSIVSCGK